MAATAGCRCPSTLEHQKKQEEAQLAAAAEEAAAAAEAAAAEAAAAEAQGAAVETLPAVEAQQQPAAEPQGEHQDQKV